jgi:hypothetical protein
MIANTGKKLSAYAAAAACFASLLGAVIANNHTPLPHASSALTPRCSNQILVAGDGQESHGGKGGGRING